MSSSIEAILMVQEPPGDQCRVVREDVGALIGLLGAVTATLPWVVSATLWPRTPFVKVLTGALVLTALAGLASALGRRWDRRTTSGWWVVAAILRGLGTGLAIATGLVLLIEMQARGVRACSNGIGQAIAHLLHP